MAPNAEKMADIVETCVDVSEIFVCLVSVRVARVLDNRVEFLQVRNSQSVQFVATDVFPASVT